MKKSKNITGFDFLWLALYTTAAFLFELLLVTVEGFWGISLYHATKFQMIAHWIVTSLGWAGLVSVSVLLLWLKSKLALTF